jgi:hypothetical protein
MGSRKEEMQCEKKRKRNAQDVMQVEREPLQKWATQMTLREIPPR